MINEATTPYDNPDIDYGLMTLDEFYKARNPKNEWHPDEAYTTSVAKLNHDYSRRSIYSHGFKYETHKEILSNKRGYIFLFDGEPVAVITNDHLYYTNKFPLKTLPFSYTGAYINQESFDIQMPSQKTQVKYLADYISALDPVANENMEEFPILLQNIVVGGKPFRVKTVANAKKDRGSQIVILNDSNLVIAAASAEWGTTLLQVADEYSGFGFGKILGKYWYEANPDWKSGGFTQAGYNNAKHIWADRVRKLLQNGWYQDLVKAKKITPQKVKEIIADLPEKKKVKKEFEKEEKKEPLVYADGTTFVIYDKKFLTDQDDKYIYAHGFLRDNDDKLFLYTIDYINGFGKIANTVAFQMARDDGSNELDISYGGSDFIEQFPIDGVEYRDGKAITTKDIMKLSDFSKLEKIVRKPYDKYDEIYNSLLEMGESKWK